MKRWDILFLLNVGTCRADLAAVQIKDNVRFIELLFDIAVLFSIVSFIEL